MSGDLSEESIQQEKEKARRLKATAWWKQKKSRGVCHYCEQTVAPVELTMDHLVPLARGGRSTRGNLVPACRDCNQKKKGLLLMEWDQFSE
jgi:5-methylcytosine-specific restriction endonuclease McrA